MATSGMTDTRPVLLGMNNPHSQDPRWDLAPFPNYVAGHRLWRLVHDVCGISRKEWMYSTDRRNLLHARDWDPVAAREESEGLWETLQERQVTVLGRATARVLWLPVTPPLVWREDRGVRWCYMPHPSGLCQWYNTELHRLAAGLRLEDLITQQGEHE